MQRTSRRRRNSSVLVPVEDHRCVDCVAEDHMCEHCQLIEVARSVSEDLRRYAWETEYRP